MRYRVVVALVLMLGACGPSAQQKVLSGTLAGLNAARDGFLEYDQKHQAELVKNATTYEGGMTSLTLYREKREPVLEAFLSAYELLALALEDTTAGKVAAAVEAAEHVYKLVKRLMESEAPPAPRPVATTRSWMRA